MKTHYTHYALGEIIWHRGEEVQVTGRVERIYGGEFQKATTKSGATVLVATPLQRAMNAQHSQEQFRQEQKACRRLRSS